MWLVLVMGGSLHILMHVRSVRCLRLQPVRQTSRQGSTRLGNAHLKLISMSALSSSRSSEAIHSYI